MTVLRSIVTNKVTGRRRWLLRPLRGRRLLWFVCLDLALALGLVWAGVIPSPYGAPQCPATERGGGVDPPIVEVMAGYRENDFLVHTTGATCVVVSFDLRRRPDGPSHVGIRASARHVAVSDRCCRRRDGRPLCRNRRRAWRRRDGQGRPHFQGLGTLAATPDRRSAATAPAPSQAASARSPAATGPPQPSARCGLLASR